MTRGLTLLGYVVLVAVAVVLEVAARHRGTTTSGDVLRRGLRWHPFRLALLVAWLWLGWHLFVRVDWQ
jgi:Family of unknown function (DUF6186)